MTQIHIESAPPSSTCKRSYHQLVLYERQFIFRCHHYEKRPLREIARMLNRSPSTISREIRRHTYTSYVPCYYPNLAEHDCTMMKRKRGKRLRLKCEETRKYVEEHLKRGWSPEIISGRLHLEPGMTPVSHEAIYQFIYKERGDLAVHLPRMHRKRKPKFPKRKTPMESVQSKTPISQRPDDINQRISHGHWESDSVVDRSHTGINVIVERMTRIVHITKLVDGTSESTARAILSRLSTHPREFTKSITYDNGSENSKHLMVNSTLGCTSYFCEPYHSWEKGLVENVNEKIRRYIPKKTDMNSITQEYLSTIEDALNNRPRKCLAFRTPNEAYHAWVASLPISPEAQARGGGVALTH